MRKYILYVLFISIVFASCEKDVLFKEPKFDEKLVVEGYIETGQPPYIILTRNTKYYGQASLNDIGNSFVHNAIIKVSNGIDTVTLTEMTIDTAGITIGIYTDPTFFINPSATKILGQSNTSYSLWIEAGGLKVSSVTTIPQSYPLDSIWYEENVVSTKPNLVRLMCRYTDPPELGQYARYFTSRNNQAFLPGYSSVFEDNLINGTTFDFPLDRGVNRNASDSSIFKDYGYFYKGDTITVKWCNIDYYTYKFYRTLEFELNNDGPFSSPVMVQSNIKNGLGVWAGYNTSFKTLVIPH